MSDEAKELLSTLCEIVAVPRPAPESVAEARRYLDGLLPARLPAVLEVLAGLARPLREVVAGERIPDPDDRLQAVRFTLALHALEGAVLAGGVGEEDVPNELYMGYAQLEEALEAALPPRPGFQARPAPRPQPGAPGAPGQSGPIRLE